MNDRLMEKLIVPAGVGWTVAYQPNVLYIILNMRAYVPCVRGVSSKPYIFCAENQASAGPEVIALVAVLGVTQLFRPRPAM
jgi:hypothetical protein